MTQSCGTREDFVYLHRPRVVEILVFAVGKQQLEKHEKIVIIFENRIVAYGNHRLAQSGAVHTVNVVVARVHHNVDGFAALCGRKKFNHSLAVHALHHVYARHNVSKPLHRLSALGHIARQPFSVCVEDKHHVLSCGTLGHAAAEAEPTTIVQSAPRLAFAGFLHFGSLGFFERHGLGGRQPHRVQRSDDIVNSAAHLCEFGNMSRIQQKSFNHNFPVSHAPTPERARKNI